MSYLEIVAWAAGGAALGVLVLLLISGFACAIGWHQIEGTANTMVVLVTFVLIGGTVVLLAVATASYFSLL